MENVLIPSIIASSQEELEDLVSRVKNYYPTVQIDIMDGKFVKNKSFDFDFDLPEGVGYEAHLMVKDPMSWIRNHSDKVSWIIFHIEAVSIDSVKEIISEIKSRGKKVGIAISPDTAAHELDNFIKDLDIVIVMSVYPGKYGSEFLPATMEKVRELRLENKELTIEVDGGMDLENIKLAMESGANRFISGSFLMNSQDISKTSNEINLILEGGDL